MFRRNGFALPVFGGLAALAVASGCGGSPSGNAVPHPLVRQFSPTMSPIDFNSLQANPTFTDGMLTISTDPLYPGKICIFFQSETKIDPASVFIGGNPALGIDLSALQILNYVPGIGNIPLQPAPNGVQVLDDRIIFTPSVLPLPNGQYSIGVFANIKSTEGDPVAQAPVFHSFTVGASDTIRPTIVVTNPIHGATGVGAGVAPPAPPSNLPASSIADVRTNIFGAVSPDVVIRFSEAVDATTVNVNNISAVNAGAPVIPPPIIPPAPGFPKLKAQIDGSTLPSNGFEIVWRADPAQGGLPFGTQVAVTVIGDDSGANADPIRDRSGNKLEFSTTFQFQTVGRPNFPQNPEPEYGFIWSASDRIGALDVPNQHEQALVFLGLQTTQAKRNHVPQYTDTIATKQTLGTNFDPNEISIDARTSGASCHTYAYVQSNQGGQVIFVNTRNSLPVAIVNTSSPGGVSNQTGFGSANVLLATNSFANTYTVFDLSNITPGLEFLNGPIFIKEVVPTGNNPRAIVISTSVFGNAAYNRDNGLGGPGTPLIMYADYSDGVVKTGNLGRSTPIKQFALGTGASPNDISMTACFGLPPILFAAISEGASPGQGKIAYYIAGPGCETGVSTNIRPDAIVGDLGGFEAPSGLDCLLSFSTQSPPGLFAMAMSGSNEIGTFTIQTGTLNLPRQILALDTGANPIAVSHRAGYLDVLTTGSWICQLFTPGCPTLASAFQPPPCWYSGTEQYPTGADQDGGFTTSVDLFVCARGAGRVEVINSNSGAVDFYSPVSIPGIRYIASTTSQ
jgi:hypothetical protein